MDEVYTGQLPINSERITVYVPRSLGVNEQVTKIWLTFSHCGHTGTVHDKLVVCEKPLVEQEEHGRCMADGCDCKQFTWREFVTTR
jgi:hypothetical protein